MPFGWLKIGEVAGGSWLVAGGGQNRDLWVPLSGCYWRFRFDLGELLIGNEGDRLLLWWVSVVDSAGVRRAGRWFRRKELRETAVEGRRRILCSLVSPVCLAKPKEKK
uniref:Uncharacterized protein n=1 Tax=Populus alba TaxID=43335 RepID=A0A4U5M4Y7_POPAL|nr:hypothetical protein D5086_0000320590 [Populus alba]